MLQFFDETLSPLVFSKQQGKQQQQGETLPYLFSTWSCREGIPKLDTTLWRAFPRRPLTLSSETVWRAAARRHSAWPNGGCGRRDSRPRIRNGRRPRLGRGWRWRARRRRRARSRIAPVNICQRERERVEILFRMKKIEGEAEKIRDIYSSRWSPLDRRRRRLSVRLVCLRWQQCQNDFAKLVYVTTPATKEPRKSLALPSLCSAMSRTCRHLLTYTWKKFAFVQLILRSPLKRSSVKRPSGLIGQFSQLPRLGFSTICSDKRPTRFNIRNMAAKWVAVKAGSTVYNV